MTTPDRLSEVEFGGSASYRIVFQGTVSERWHHRLGGMEITPSSPETGKPHTALRGRLGDQAALRGVLETLYALHLPILEVTRVDGPDKNAAES